MTRPLRTRWLLLLPIGCAVLQSGAARAQAVSDSFELPPLDAFAAIVERPLFSPDRRPVASPAAPESDSPQAAATAPEGQLLLAGTATDQGERAVAILHDMTQGTQYRVWVGDQVGGWTVQAIRPREIVLAHEKREVTVTLDEPALPGPVEGQ